AVRPLPRHYRGRSRQLVDGRAVLGLADLVPALRLRARCDDLGDAGRARAHCLGSLCALDTPRGARLTRRLFISHALTLVALVMAATYLFPLYWMYVTSLKSASEIFANPPPFWPAELTINAYPGVWSTR